MDIFRPLLGRNIKLKTFSAPDGSPETAFIASLNQIKRLALVFISRYPEATHCVWVEQVPKPCFRLAGSLSANQN